MISGASSTMQSPDAPSENAQVAQELGPLIWNAAGG
jgi:hypothetical protein